MVGNMPEVRLNSRTFFLFLLFFFFFLLLHFRGPLNLLDLVGPPHLLPPRHLRLFPLKGKGFSEGLSGGSPVLKKVTLWKGFLWRHGKILVLYQNYQDRLCKDREWNFSACGENKAVESIYGKTIGNNPMVNI